MIKERHVILFTSLELHLMLWNTHLFIFVLAAVNYNKTEKEQLPMFPRNAKNAAFCFKDIPVENKTKLQLYPVIISVKP